MTVCCLDNRIQVTGSVKAHVNKRGFGAAIKTIAQLKPSDISDDLLDRTRQKHGMQTSDVIRAADTPPALQAALSALQVSTASIPGSDGARIESTHSSGRSRAIVTMRDVNDLGAGF